MTTRKRRLTSPPDPGGLPASQPPIQNQPRTASSSSGLVSPTPHLTLLQQSELRIFSGPIPSLQDMLSYEEILPGSAERFITHNATTMEAASVWYGVTLSYPDISRVLGMQVPAKPEAS